MRRLVESESGVELHNLAASDSVSSTATPTASTITASPSDSVPSTATPTASIITASPSDYKEELLVSPPPIKEWIAQYSIMIVIGAGRIVRGVSTTSGWPHIVGKNRETLDGFLDVLTQFITTELLKKGLIKQFNRPVVYDPSQTNVQKNQKHHGEAPYCRLHPAAYSVLASVTTSEKGLLKPIAELETYEEGVTPTFNA